MGQDGTYWLFPYLKRACSFLYFCLWKCFNSILKVTSILNQRRDNCNTELRDFNIKDWLPRGVVSPRPVSDSDIWTMPSTTPFNLVSSELARQSHWMTAGFFQLKYSVLFHYSLRCAQFTAISLCNWRGQWCSKSCIPAFSTSTHRGEQPPCPNRVYLMGMISERTPTSVTTCCSYSSCVGCPSLLIRDDSSLGCTALYLAGASHCDQCTQWRAKRDQQMGNK